MLNDNDELKWLKADFHLHTKADKEFLYNGDSFIKDYITALKSSGIKIGVITNHNKFDLDEFNSLQRKAKEEEIYLLPGVEFSVNDGSKGIHILIIFDDNWIHNKENRNYIQDFLIGAFNGKSNFDIPPYPNSNYNLKETYEKLNIFNKDYFFVLAHVDDDNGLFKELKGRNLENFVRMECFQKVLGLQKSENKDNYQKLTNLINKSIAQIEGTDNAQKGLAGISNSTRFCYLKIGDFNFDAIKFALIAHKNRVSHDKTPDINNSFIKSISFEGGLLNGTKIKFSPELNTLIGIRGSGKSAIIEILRYVLAIPFTSTSVDKDYKNKLVEYVLGSGGKVILEVVNRHKEKYKIEKILGQKEDIYKNDIIQNGISINAIIPSILYFGQKDLSNKDADFESDLIRRLTGNKLDNIQKQIGQKKQEVASVIFEMEKIKNLNELKNETLTTIADAEHQLKIFEDKKIEEKLRTQASYDSDISILSSYYEEINNFIDEIQKTIDGNKGIFETSISGSEINKEYYSKVDQIIEKIKISFQKIPDALKEIKNLIKEYHLVIDAISKKREELKDQFAKIKREINIQNINPDRFLELKRIIQTNQLKLKEIEKSEKQRQNLNDELFQKLVDLNELWHKEFKILKDEIEKINQNKTKINIEIEFKGRRDEFLNKMKQIFRGTNIRESNYQEITEHYKDFIEIYKDFDNLNLILNQNQLFEFKKRFYENLIELLCFRVNDKIIIKYNGKEMSKHSLGQRASALILFILSQHEQDILIIDQPEDDLDNQSIYHEVIKKILELKGNMQFIFATHNPNIPVLGDSEKIIVTSYDENRINIIQGNIDKKETQQYIIDIMEGGQEAFNRRKDIYNNWKVPEKQ